MSTSRNEGHSAQRAFRRLPLRPSPGRTRQPRVLLRDEPCEVYEW